MSFRASSKFSVSERLRDLKGATLLPQICRCHLKGYKCVCRLAPACARRATQKAGKEGQEKSLAKSCQKYTKETLHKSKAQRHEMCESQTSITWRMYFCKICDGVKLKKKKEKNATLAVHSHLSCRA